MKKIILGLILVLSVGALADDGPFENQEEMLEKRFEMTQNELTDGKIKLGEVDYEIDIYENNILVQLEIEPFSGDGNWSEFNKKTFDELMQNMADEIRNSIGNSTIPVNISVEIERRFKKDEMVYNKTF